MSTFSLALAGSLCPVLALFSCLVGAQQKIETKTSAADESLRAFLQTQADDKETRYIAVFRDLNGDEVPEAIVYLVGNEWCGSGGCNLFILRKIGSSWKTVTSITITNPPVRMFADTSSGWHNIGVQVRGGGMTHGYEAELRFNGKTYANNPTVPPARSAGKGVTGEVIIPSLKDAKPLF